MEQLYGESYVCSVGTYQTLKIKSGIKDFGKLNGLGFDKLNYLTQYISFKEGKDGDFEEIFIKAQQDAKLKEFIKNYPHIINDLSIILKHPKSKSIHPCATIIFPQLGGNMYERTPLRKENNIIVSELEGPQLETCGYLKEDILGIIQLEKIQLILDLIKNSIGKEIDIYSIPIDDPNVMYYFKKGYNSDIFQFGSRGLTNYCKEVIPDNFLELANIVALFRPGVMQTNGHNDYINIKYKRKEAEYDYGLEEVTKSTFGIYIFQEQIMKGCEILGDFDPVSQDKIRKGMGKKQLYILLPYKKKFIEKAIEKGCPEDEAEHIWEKFEYFAQYGFNKSHAVCYAMLGYVTQWLKCYYPIQFWTAALQFVKDDKEHKEDLMHYMSEIHKTNEFIKIVPPDINNSDITFKSNFKTGKIYWSLLKIKFLAEIGTGVILEERAKNGKFYSIKDFWSRVPKAKVNKRIIINLILSGSFDEICEIKDLREREELIREYIKLAGLNEEDIPILNESERKHEWFWILKQKELSGLGIIDYRKLIYNSELTKQTQYFIEGIHLNIEENIDKFCTFGGIVKKIKPGKSVKGPWVMLTLDHNNEEVFVNIWNEQYENFKELINSSENKLVLLSGTIRYNDYRKVNIIQLDKRSQFIKL